MKEPILSNNKLNNMTIEIEVKAVIIVTSNVLLIENVSKPFTVCNRNTIIKDCKIPTTANTENLLAHQLMPFLGRRSEEHTSELQSRFDLVCRLLLEIKKALRSVH